ncbi:caspase family protein [Candidatus Magnetomonas plexicatena]|uniref:caspase family protein n=1 Tax=Candidatus Magnetomonas plexicatena TaxID=2552947 RepID=UPI001C75CC7E|nr:hypothetical protein E2O03_006675 [Nitrospirales bacterium LBB_01]
MPTEPPTEPILRINTEMHTAPILRIGVDAANKYLVTGSHDKTVKVWDIRDLSSVKLIQTLRVPIGLGDEGKIYAVAISPDGKTIVCGGWSAEDSIYIFDRQTRKIVKRIAGLLDVISHLAYSKDGGFLAATLGGTNGIRIYETNNYTQTASDSEYDDGSFGADFDKEGRLVTSSNDGYIRLYDSDFKLIKKEKSQGGNKPFSVRFSPDGSQIAVGFADTSKVDILSGADLSYQYSPDTSGANNNLGRVSFSPDGKYLYAGGKTIANGQHFIRKWLDSGRGQYKDLSASNSTIMQIISLKNGGIVFGSQDPAFGIFDSNDTPIVFKQSDIADYRGIENAPQISEEFQISQDAKTIRFWYEPRGNSPKVFSLKDRELLDVSDLKDDLLKPIFKSEKLNITYWLNNDYPKLNGTPLKLKQYEVSRSLAILPNDSGFLLGTEWYLRFFDTNGKEKWNASSPGVVWNVNVSPDGKIAVAAFIDGTIRWYRVSDGKELLAFFPLNDTERNKWVLWTPTGYYDASVGGDELIGWHVNRGKDKEADFYSVSKFSHIYYRPDIVSKVLDTLDEDEAIRQANAEANRKPKAIPIMEMLPPKVRIISPADGAKTTSTEVTIDYELQTPADAPVTSLMLLVNGVSQPCEDNVNKTSNKYEIKTTIQRKDSEIRLIAINKNAASVPAVVMLNWQGIVKRGGFVELKPNLYILAVGIDNYTIYPQLSYSVEDADKFVKVMEKQEGKLYKKVEVNLILDKDATRDRIKSGLKWIKEEATNKDVSILMFSGHGSNDDDFIYHYIPVAGDREDLTDSAIPQALITTTLYTTLGKRILFMDTCNSGNVVGGARGYGDNLTGFINALNAAENGVILFASSKRNQASLESGAWRNGAFTKAVLEGLNGEAKLNNDGLVTVDSLNHYTADRVKELTNKKQATIFDKPARMDDIPIAVSP